MNPDDLAKVPKSQILRGLDLLKILPPQTRLFESISSSGSHSSELSGPFSEVVYTKEVESKRRAKQLYGKDLYTAFSFSSEFISAVEELKKQTLQENPDCFNTEDVVREPKCESSECTQSEVSSVVYECIPFPGIDYEVNKDDAEDAEETEEAEDKRKTRARFWLDEDEAFDAMSGYWKMLTVFDKFRISPPWYDAYAEGQVHWLQTKPISSEVLENSRKKCLNWLNKYFDD